MNIIEEIIQHSLWDWIFTTAIPVAFTWYLSGRHKNKKVINDIRIQIEQDNAKNEEQRIIRLQKMINKIQVLYEEKVEYLDLLTAYEMKINSLKNRCQSCNDNDKG